MNQQTNPAALSLVQDAQPTLDDLAAKHLEARAHLAAAQEHLNNINDQIIKAVGVKDEGSFSVDGDSFKVTTSQTVRRTIDLKQAQELYQQLPRDLADGLLRFKPDVSVKVFKDIQKYQPETFALVAKYIVSKPGKPTVTVKTLDRPEAA